MTMTSAMPELTALIDPAVVGRRDPERDGRFMLVLPRPAAGTPTA